MASKEHAQQAFVFKWCKMYKHEIPELELLFAIQNQIPHLSKMPKQYMFSTINYMKAEGLKKGIPDLFLPVPRQGKHGLFIEMKYGKGKTSPEQDVWLDMLDKQGYCVSVCYTWKEAVIDLLEYLEVDKNKYIL